VPTAAIPAASVSRNRKPHHPRIGCFINAPSNVYGRLQPSTGTNSSVPSWGLPRWLPSSSACSTFSAAAVKPAKSARLKTKSFFARRDTPPCSGAADWRTIFHPRNRRREILLEAAVQPQKGAEGAEGARLEAVLTPATSAAGRGLPNRCTNNNSRAIPAGRFPRGRRRGTYQSRRAAGRRRGHCAERPRAR